MSELLNKSEQNIDAADYLIRQKQLYAPSVHCSYYACVQLMKYLLLTRHHFTQESLDQEIREQNTGFHPFSRKQLCNRIRSIHPRDAASLNRWLKDLYNFRVESDYLEKHIGQAAAGKAQHIADSIIETLKEHYQL
ncbi:MAG: HEPN domain-containing protein [Bacteroidota bacterium]